ncbi:MAG: DUF1573 domain-containing protein [bacterium]|nr:DUF1573 domain-containing protein [bacterium]
MNITRKLFLRKHKIKFVVLGIAIVVVAFIWLGQPKSNNLQSGVSGSGNLSASLSLSESSFDFGTISMANGNVHKVVKVKNIDTNPVVLRKLYTSCMCTAVKMSHAGKEFGPYGMQGHGFIPSMDEVLGVGEEADIEITFDPNAHGPAGVGRISRVVFLENDAGAPLQITFKTFVTP